MEQQNNQYEYSYNEQGCEGENGISYVLGITECISYKQFRDIVVTIIKELRSIQGEFLVVNVYCPNPAGIHFLQVCANDDNSYELEICKEVKDSIVFGKYWLMNKVNVLKSIVIIEIIQTWIRL